jgi:hypothetical protein
MVLAAALALGAMVAAAAPASASGPTGGVAYWWLPCQGSTGELIGLTGNTLAHTFTPCQPPGSNDVYGVATYRATDARGYLVWIPQEGGGNTWTVQILVGTGTQAVCLLDAPDHRIACAEVVPAGGGFALGAALPIDSPVVSVTATFPSTDRQPPVGPNCLSCPT